MAQPALRPAIGNSMIARRNPRSARCRLLLTFGQGQRVSRMTFFGSGRGRFGQGRKSRPMMRPARRESIPRRSPLEVYHVFNLGAPAGWVRRSVDVGRGLASVEQATGTLVAYATAPNQQAADGTGRNSPFAAALLRWIDVPGVELRQMFTRVREAVYQTMEKKQLPWVNDGPIGDFYFRPPGTSLNHRLRQPCRCPEGLNGSDIRRPTAASATRECSGRQPPRRAPGSSGPREQPLSLFSDTRSDASPASDGALTGLGAGLIVHLRKAPAKPAGMRGLTGFCTVRKQA
jgi:hypothetical protein